MSQKFDLVIVGAGCIGMAAAYYALKMNRTVCVIEKNEIGDQQKFWSEHFVARQMRTQSNEEYVTRFIRMSNDEWTKLEQDLGKPFIYRQGSLWFGDRNINTVEGNIRTARETFAEINSCLREGEKKIESLYMERVMQESPNYMKAFKPQHHNQWDSWSGLYQPDGGSLDMKASYDAFYNHVKSKGNKAVIYDKTSVVKHECSKTEFKHKFTTSSSKVIQGKSVFLCTGVSTPHFLKEVMNYPHLVDNNFKGGESGREYSIQEYVSSYLKIEEGYEHFYSKMPAFINFMKEKPHERHFTTFGFPFHEWDTVKKGNFIKLGSMDCRSFHSSEQESKFLKGAQFHSLHEQDHRVHGVISYAMNRMNGVSSKSPMNKHYPYPMIFYEGRETLLDYMQRRDESVVVQSGGWMVNQYPLMAKTVVQMLFEPATIRKEMQEMTVIGSFLNRTRFPLKPYVNDRLSKLNLNYPKNGEFKTVVIGAGCSGLYAAYRLNRCDKDSVGIFDLAQHISGGLKSFEIRTTTSPMELEQMKYIPDRHMIFNEMVMDLGIPNIPFPAEGEMTQSRMPSSPKMQSSSEMMSMNMKMKMSMKMKMKMMMKMKMEGLRMMDWQSAQKMESRVMPSFRMKGHMLGMTAYQIISFSMYQILTAPENVGVVTELFLQKSKEEIDLEKKQDSCCGMTVYPEDFYYRNWKNYIYQNRENPLCHCINLSLEQWNKIRPILLFRFPYEVTQKDTYDGQEKVEMSELFPLYKFGFQNVLESQFCHETYLFVAQQNGYYSNMSNASYLDQVMVYFLDFGDVTYRTLAGGFDNINYAMANELLDEQRGLTCRNGGIYLGHKLVNIEKVNNKYLLTFHLKNQASPLSKQDPFKTQLLSGVKKTKLFNLIHKGLALPVPLPDKQGFSSIQFMTERLILGMPKQAIQMLYNEIDLLQEPISTYEHFYKADRRHYESLLHYTQLKEELPKAKKYMPLNCTQCEQLEKLKMKHELCEQMPQSQVKRMNELQERSFYEKGIMKPNIDMKYEQQKFKKFMEDEPLVPKTLCSLLDTTESMPGMRIMMNFCKNWWDPIERINESCCKQPSKSMRMSTALQEMKTQSSSEMLNRHTLQLSMGQDNLMLCTFNDRTTTQFWITLHKNFEKVWHPKSETMKEMKYGAYKRLVSCSPDLDVQPAKEVLVREILKELSRIYNMEVREDWLKECVYQFMGNEQSGASHHFKSGYYVPSVMQTMRRPWKDQCIHFVGEAFSNTSGWVEGAFQTTEMLMQREFGLTPMFKGYYAGY